MFQKLMAIGLVLVLAESGEANNHSSILKFILPQEKTRLIRERVDLALQQRAQKIQDAKKGKCEIISDANVASSNMLDGSTCFKAAFDTVNLNKEFYLFQSLKINWNGKNIYGKDQVGRFETKIIPELTTMKVSYDCKIVLSGAVSPAYQSQLTTSIVYEYPRAEVKVVTGPNGEKSYPVWNEVSSKCGTFIDAKLLQFRDLLLYNGDAPANFKVYIGNLNITSLVTKP